MTDSVENRIYTELGKLRASVDALIEANNDSIAEHRRHMEMCWGARADYDKRLSALETAEYGRTEARKPWKIAVIHSVVAAIASAVTFALAVLFGVGK